MKTPSKAKQKELLALKATLNYSKSGIIESARTFGYRLKSRDIERDIEAGFETNTDGTLNLIDYLAWILRQNGDI